jgi:predicted SAM-dependent methyltransferase
MGSFSNNYLRKIYVHVFKRGLIQNFKTAKSIFSWHLKRQFGRVDREIIGSYLAEHQTRKLHIGCGFNNLENWLNSDCFPHSNNVLHLDARETFPFKDNQFDYIFSEHMIEHVSFTNGLYMLKECYRILNKNGKIRVSTPNLQFLIDLYRSNKSDIQNNYIRWSTDAFLKNAPIYDATFVINNFVRDWGHLFIYDERTLRFSLESVGFKNITKCALNESDDDSLVNLENENRMPDGFLALESLILEGTKQLN